MRSHTKVLSRKQSFNKTDSKKKLVIRHQLPLTFFLPLESTQLAPRLAAWWQQKHILWHTETQESHWGAWSSYRARLFIFCLALFPGLFCKKRTDSDLYFHVLNLYASSIAWGGYQGEDTSGEGGFGTQVATNSTCQLPHSFPCSEPPRSTLFCNWIMLSSHRQTLSLPDAAGTHQLSLPDQGWLPSQSGSFACNILLTLRAFFPPFPDFPGPLLWATFDRKLDTSLKLSFVFHFEPFFFPPKPNFWFLYRLLAFGLKNNQTASLPIFLSSRISQEGTCICWQSPFPLLLKRQKLAHFSCRSILATVFLLFKVRKPPQAYFNKH